MAISDVLDRDSLFLGRYRVIRRIAAGGMGAVYEVRDEKTDKRRALKVMLPSILEDPDFRVRFEREARITGGIESDHVVHVSDAGIDESTTTPFLVMELLSGQELSQIVKKRGGLPPAEALVYLTQAARGLDKTHAAGIVHRDLKPENLFITTADDGSPRLKILDFGIAKVVAPGADKATRALGTPKYMAPEQMKGEELGAFTDIYAFGHIAYTILTGEAYWVEEEKAARDALFAFLAKIVAGPEEPASERARRRRGVELPVAFDAWFFQATAPKPAERFPSAGAAIAALAPVFGAEMPSGFFPRGPSLSVSAGQTSQNTVQADGGPEGDGEPGTTGKTFGSTAGQSNSASRWKRGVALFAALALLGGGAFGIFTFVARPAPTAVTPGTVESRGADTVAPQSNGPIVVLATSAPVPTAAPGPVGTTAPAETASSPKGRSSSKSPANGQAVSAASATATASAKPTVPGVVDPWAAPTKSSRSASPPPAATGTKPGMF